LSPASEQKPYSILSIDGGGMRNIITLKVLKYFEEYGCHYIKEKQFSNVKCTDDGKLPIKDIFDMIAGTSTGGVIAAALAVPTNSDMNQTYSAAEVLESFKEQAPIIFAVQKINSGLIWIITIISAMIGSVLGHKIGKKRNANPNVAKTIRRLKRFIRELENAKSEFE
jgi:predicted acylesterase/phospholipase RssA